MDDNVMTVLKMLQEGKISSQEAEKLISALRGDGRGATPPPPPDPPQPNTPPEADKRFGGFDTIKPPKLDFDDLGSKISSAIAKVQPEKIVRKVQSQLHDAVRAGARWGNSFPNRVWHWAEGADQRPEKPESWHDRTDDQEHTFHLEANAAITVENPIGNVQIKGTTGQTATVKIHKQVWSAFPEDLEKTHNTVEIATHATDTRLDIKVNVPDHFFEGVVDIVMEVPAEVTARISTRYGDIEVEELSGRVEGVTSAGELSFRHLKGDARGETASGDAHLEHIAGMVSIATQSGDIHAEHIHKGITANAVSGDVHIEHIEGGAVECKSVSGDAHAEHIGNTAPLEITVESVSGDCHLSHAIGNIRLKAVSGDVQAEHLNATNLQAQTVSGCIHLNLDAPFSGMMQMNTVSGDVQTALPNGSNVRITLGTNSGELSCDHPVTEKTSSTTFWVGIVGTGAGTLNVQTISGDVHIGKA
jgi:DUF4097 and DUF4098 domain-containing protein YvlB